MRRWTLLGWTCALCWCWMATHAFHRVAGDRPDAAQQHVVYPTEEDDVVRLHGYARNGGPSDTDRWRRNGPRRHLSDAGKKDLAKRLNVGEILQILRKVSAEQGDGPTRGRLKGMRFGVSRKRSRPSLPSGPWTDALFERLPGR